VLANHNKSLRGDLVRPVGECVSYLNHTPSTYDRRKEGEGSVHSTMGIAITKHRYQHVGTASALADTENVYVESWEQIHRDFMSEIEPHLCVPTYTEMCNEWSRPVMITTKISGDTLSIPMLYTMNIIQRDVSPEKKAPTFSRNWLLLVKQRCLGQPKSVRPHHESSWRVDRNHPTYIAIQTAYRLPSQSYQRLANVLVAIQTLNNPTVTSHHWLDQCV
jgi:hypothetical protein